MRALACTAALAAVVSSALGRSELLNYDPVANASAVVEDPAGGARFTVLTPRLIRMEQAAARGVFEDLATLAVVNRALPVPAFSASWAGGTLTLSTAALTLTYVSGVPFSPATLSVAFAGAAFAPWRYGDASPGNLLGTIRTLDGGTPFPNATAGDTPPLNCTLNAQWAGRHSDVCEWGLVSRQGWAIYNDSGAPVLGADDWWAPAAGGGTAFSADAEDLYGFFHGHDYRGALADYVLVGGRAALVPRAASGVWWSRWMNLDAEDAARVVEDYDSRRVPLDVYIFDMDWHAKNSWGGYSFDPQVFPASAAPELLSFLASRGLSVGLNLHDSLGVGAWEPAFPALAAALGLPPNATSAPLDLVNATAALAMEDIAVAPIFYPSDAAAPRATVHWIDWQQGATAGGLAGGRQNPTIWLAKMRATSRRRLGQRARGVLLSRFGGLGAHRYPLGFSGDVGGGKTVAAVNRTTWANLAYQPYFSATAANVAFGFWSHDIMGPMEDPELFVRYAQWGAVSGVMRSHGRGMTQGPCADVDVGIRPALWAPPSGACEVVEPWAAAPDVFGAVRDALTLRSRLVPIVYNGHRAAFDTGVGLLAPMYYEAPEADRAYDMDGSAGRDVQFLFGPDIVVAPVVAPAGGGGPGANARLLLAEKTTWLPPGEWVDVLTGAATVAPAPGGAALSTGVALGEVPAWMRAGAVLPFVPTEYAPSLTGLAAGGFRLLGFAVVPGGPGSGAARVYEDDGATDEYLTAPPGAGAAVTTATYARSGNTTTVTVATAGGFPSMPAARTVLQVRLLGVGAPAAVRVNGVPLPFARRPSIGFAPPAASAWSFAAADAGLTRGAGLVVDVVGAPVGREPLLLEVVAAGPPLPAALLGALSRARAAKAALDLADATVGSSTPVPAQLTRLAAMSGVLAAAAGGGPPEAFAADAVAAAGTMLDAAIAEVQGMPPGNTTNPARVAYALALLLGARGGSPQPVN